MIHKELLELLLQKRLGASLASMESKAKEQMKTLAYTSKHYLNLNQAIERLIKGYQAHTEKKQKENLKQKKAKKNKAIKSPTYLTRSKTEMDIHNRKTKKELQSSTLSKAYTKPQVPLSSSSPSTLKKNLQMNTKTVSSELKKVSSKTNKLNKTPNKQRIENSHSQSESQFNKALSVRTSTLTSFYSKRKHKIRCKLFNDEFSIENYSKSAIKEHETTFITKRLKPSEEYKEELISIQKQILDVKNTIVNTEKALENKQRTSLLSISMQTEPNELSESNCFNDYNNKKWVLSVSAYLTLIDKLNFYSTSKVFKRLFIKSISQLKNKIESALNIPNHNLSTINDQLIELAKKYQPEINQPYAPFQITRGSQKAIELLNGEMYSMLYLKTSIEPQLKELIVVYRIYHQLMNNDSIVFIQDDELFWNKSCRYLQLNGKEKLGSFISDSIQLFCFDDRNVLRLKQLVENVKAKITPSYYSKICGGTGLLVFLLKDALEYCGVLYSEKKTPLNRIYNNLLYEKKVMEHLNKYCNSLIKM